MLTLATAQEYGETFETGRPVLFRFLRNTQGAPKPGFNDTYQQKIEPAGLYVVHNPEPGDLPRGWVAGVMRFNNPLVIPFNTERGTYDGHSWKMMLYRHYGKRGKVLSKALVRDGYDGIVTVGQDETREIVNLVWPRKG